MKYMLSWLDLPTIGKTLLGGIVLYSGLFTYSCAKKKYKTHKYNQTIKKDIKKRREIKDICALTYEGCD